MLRKLVALGVAAACVTGVRPLLAQEWATFVLNDGRRIRGELVAIGDYGFDIRVNGRERSVDRADLASIVFAGGRAPAGAQMRIDAGEPLVILRDGQALPARLSDIINGRGATRFVFDTPRGTRELAASDIAQIHLGYPDNGAVGTSGQSNRGWGRSTPRWGQTDEAWGAGNAAASVTVPANSPWTDTGITVGRGERIQFAGEGHIMVAADASSGVGGSPIAPGGRLPFSGAGVGALIARIGNGAPFLIGSNTGPIPMPADGPLFLGVNDEHFPDNTGRFSVRISRLSR